MGVFGVQTEVFTSFCGVGDAVFALVSDVALDDRETVPAVPETSLTAPQVSGEAAQSTTVSCASHNEQAEDIVEGQEDRDDLEDPSTWKTPDTIAFQKQPVVENLDQIKKNITVRSEHHESNENQTRLTKRHLRGFGEKANKFMAARRQAKRGSPAKQNSDTVAFSKKVESTPFIKGVHPQEASEAKVAAKMLSTTTKKEGHATSQPFAINTIENSSALKDQHDEIVTQEQGDNMLYSHHMASGSFTHEDKLRHDDERRDESPNATKSRASIKNLPDSKQRTAEQSSDKQKQRPPKKSIGPSKAPIVIPTKGSTKKNPYMGMSKSDSTVQ